MSKALFGEVANEWWSVEKLNMKDLGAVEKRSSINPALPYSRPLEFQERHALTGEGEADPGVSAISFTSVFSDANSIRLASSRWRICRCRNERAAQGVPALG
jgi:hypothetical protein